MRTRDLIRMYNNHCPFKYKWELVDWAYHIFGKPKSHYNKMPKDRLYAIYYNHRSKSTTKFIPFEENL